MRKITYFVAFLFALTGTVGAQNLKKCSICHGKPDFKKILESGKVVSLFVDETELTNSVHSERKCEECHRDIVEIPHSRFIKRVDCTRCHYEGNPVGAPDTTLYKDYRESVHGKAVAAGKKEAPVCQDCHGAHNIHRGSDPESNVYRPHVPETCGRCHLEIYAQFTTSIHGKLLKEGNPDVPSCTGCHGEHRILSHENPQSTIFATNVQETCSQCHSAIGLMSKYGIDVTPVATYEESFHGVASKFGMRTVANCSSCHGVHDIRPHEDPTSSVNIQNIPKTCGKPDCHPGANINFARGKIHVDPKNPESGIIYYISNFFKWLTITVMLGLVIHIVLDLSYKFRNRKASTKA
ncbi:MAG: hypothetical protein ACE5HI_00915 [bacterium]